VEAPLISNASWLQAAAGPGGPVADGEAFRSLLAGQTLPGGGQGSSAGHTKAFASDTLSFLTSLQDVASGLAVTAAGVGMHASPIGLAAGLGASELVSLLGKIAGRHGA